MTTPDRPEFRIAILDDYQHVALSVADWSRLDGDLRLTVFHDHVADEDQLANRLSPFHAVVVMRERTPFTRSLIGRLPRLELLVTKGMQNAAIDLAAAADAGALRAGRRRPGGVPRRLAGAGAGRFGPHLEEVRRRALRRRVPVHLVADLGLVGQCFFDGPVGDDDEAGVVVVEDAEPDVLRRQPCAAAALPLRTSAEP